MSKLNINQFKDVLTHQIKNNRFLQETGRIPVSTEIIGDSGLGKTSTVLQIAKELNLDCVKLNLAQIEELGDLVGFPIRQFEVTNGDITTWIDEHAVEEYRILGYSTTGNNRTGYCPPEWISNKGEGGILLLDDWTRADSRFVQATMELIDRQTYISWKLPKDWHIVLSANPDNGDYNVNSVDDAQKTRYVSFELKFDINVWAKWAENNNIDSRCINFLLLNPELVTSKTNPRSITTFFNSISSIKDFDSNLPLIQLLGEGSVGSEFSNLFVLFINNRLDKLISPSDIFNKDKDYVFDRIKNSLGKDGKYRADIAFTLSTRIVNFALRFANEGNKIEKSFIERIQDLVTEDEMFTNDLRFNIVKQIFNGNRIKFKDLTLNVKVAKYILG